jgi:hypothetical protein
MFRWLEIRQVKWVSGITEVETFDNLRVWEIHCTWDISRADLFNDTLSARVYAQRQVRL